MKPIKKGHIALAYVLIALVALAVRILPDSGSHPIPGVYRGYSLFDLRFMERTGREIVSGDVNPPSVYSSGVILGTQDVLRTKSLFIVLAVAGLLNEPGLDFYYGYLMWPVFIFAFFVVVLYRRACRARGEAPSDLRMLLLAGLALLGSPSMIGVSNIPESATVSGWIGLTAMVYGLVAARTKPTAFIGISLFLGITLTVAYHTATIVLFSFALVLLALRILSRRATLKSTLAPFAQSATFPLLVLLVATAYTIYVATNFLQGYVTLLNRGLGSLILGTTALPYESVLSPLIARSPPGFQVAKALVLLLLGLPILSLLIRVVTDRHVAGDPLLQPVIALIGCLAPLGLVLFLWAGPFGLLWKLTEFFSLFSIITYAAVQTQVNSANKIPKKRQPLRFLQKSGSQFVALALAGACFLGPITYVVDPLTPDSYVSFQEVAGAKWIPQHADPTEIVFTDLRMASPLIATGFLQVVGASDASPASYFASQLDAIYYSGSGADACRAISNTRTFYGQSANLVFLSSRMMQDSWGIKGYDYTMKAAPSSFFDKFQNYPAFGKVYSDGDARVYWIEACQE